MSNTRPALKPLVWLCVLFALGAAVTCAVFLVFVAGPDRGMTFYVAMSIVVAVEFVLFAHLGYSKLAGKEGPGPSVPSRIMVHALIVIWLVGTIVLAAIAVNPDNADTFTADKVLIIDVLGAFLFFLAAYFLYSYGMEVEEIDQQLVQERRKVTRRAPDMDDVVRSVEQLGRDHADHALLADRVVRKLGTLRSGLDGALVSERAVTNQSGHAQAWNAQLDQQMSQLKNLSASASTVGDDEVRDLLEGIASQAEAIMTTLRKREDSLTS